MRAMFDAVAKPITPEIELCRPSAPTALLMDYATEADDMGPTGVSQIPRRESQHQKRPVGSSSIYTATTLSV